MNIPPRSRGALRVRVVSSYLNRRVQLLLQDFIHTEEISGIILLVAAVVAIVWSNSPWAESYFYFWKTVLTIGVRPFYVSEDLQHWVNDGLMAIFFFVVGMQVKRELVHGELSDLRRAALPIAAALGGMVVPALLFLGFNVGGDGVRGWGIPMATDIAFALGVLALLGRKIPSSVRVFLLTLATVDDIGAILVIAFFYTQGLSFVALVIALLLLGVIFVLQRSGVRSAPVYVLIAVLFWVGVLKSGIHATIAGVLLGFLVPAHPYFSHSTFVESAEKLLSHCKETIIQGDRDHAEVLLGQLEELVQGTEAPLERLERQLHPWVSYVVLPLFALTNSGVTLSGEVVGNAVCSPVTLGIMVGLLVGKLLGVVGVSWLAVRLQIAIPLPQMTWSYLIGIGQLAGVGFTVSLVITGLAFEEAELVSNAKLGVFVASIIAGLNGYIYLRRVAKPAP